MTDLMTQKNTSDLPVMYPASTPPPWGYLQGTSYHVK